MAAFTRGRRALAAAALVVVGGASAPALAQYSTQVLNDNPIAYYRFEEAAGSTTAADAAALGGANNAALEGGTVGFGSAGLVAGGGSAATFGPGNGRLIAPAFDKIGTGYTVEHWLRFDALPSGCCAATVSDGDGADGDGFFLMNYVIGPAQGTQGDVRAHYSRVNNPLSTGPADSTQALVAGQVYHVVTTWNGDPAAPAANNATIYINGVLDTQLTTTKNFDPANENNPLFLGRDNREGYNNASFVMDEVAVYDYALSPARIQAHYNAGIPEPTGFALVALGGLGLLARRRR